MAEPKTAKKPVKRATARRKKLEAAPKSRGVAPDALGSGSPPAAIARLADAIEADGGSVLAAYRDPLGGHWQVLAALPIEQVEPTPVPARPLRAARRRSARAIDRLGRFLDPMIVVRTDEGRYWTPNGNHRLAALRALGARAVVALVVPEPEVAHRILLLNTEKAHNLRERALEVVRLAEGLAELDDRPERDYATEFEEPALLTLGLCYGERAVRRRSVHPVLKRVEEFLGARAAAGAGDAARAGGAGAGAGRGGDRGGGGAQGARASRARISSAFVVARINPLRFQRGAKADFDETIDKMLAAARRFDAGKVRSDQVARAGGAPEERVTMR